MHLFAKTNVDYSLSFCHTTRCCTSRLGSRAAFDFKGTWLLLTKDTTCSRQSVTYTALKSLALRSQTVWTCLIEMLLIFGKCLRI